MHTDECSRIDNNDKIPAIVDLGSCPATGARIYDLHPRRELLYEDRELLAELTGRKRLHHSGATAPHQVWCQVISATTTNKRPDGIKGSTKLVRKCKCSCMKKMKPSFCSCPICERTKDALRRYRKYQCSWRREAIMQRKKEYTEQQRADGLSDDAIDDYIKAHPEQFECQECHDKCHGVDSTYQTFSESTTTCMNALLCNKVHVPQLDMPNLDVNLNEIPDSNNEFWIHREECCYGTHTGL